MQPSLLKLTRNTNKDKETRPKQTGFLFALKWVLSFVYPITIQKKVQEDVVLELLLYLGKYRIDTEKANYSYGNLQTAYTFLFKEWKVDWSNINNALVLGFGAGGVSTLINKQNPSIKQLGVEINKQVLDWYQTYFKQVPNCKIIKADALDFVQQEKQQYDLIVVDIYKDLDVPASFMSADFLNSLKKLKSPSGWILFNKVVSSEEQKQELNDLMLAFSSQFKEVRVNEQMEINRFILVK